MKLKQLIESLEKEENNQEQEVEFIVLGKNGNVIAIDVDEKAKSMIKFLKMFAD